MSGQPSQRVRRIASPSTKQGPMKATLTFGLMQGSPTRTGNARKNSPSSSPTQQWPTEGHRVKARRSPDNRASPERASPSSPAFKVERPKPVRLSPSPSIKRTGSLDTIAGPYLTGQWPRCDTALCHIATVTTLQQPQDKATQTPEEWEEVLSSEKRKRLSLHKRSSSLGNGDQVKDGRPPAPQPESKSAFKPSKARCAKTKEGSRCAGTGMPRISPVQGHYLPFVSAGPVGCFIQSKAVAIPVTHIPKARIRGSVEGPNQEIERALKSISGVDGEELQRSSEAMADGRRAPIPELIMRTVDTQTPSAYIDELHITEEISGSVVSGSNGEENGGVEAMSGNSRSESESPEYGLIPGQMDTSRPTSQSGSSPTEGSQSPRTSKETSQPESAGSIGGEESDSPPASLLKCVPSPRPNKSFSFAREPPDGCEKVKMAEEQRSAPPLKEPLLYCPIQKAGQCRIPSVDSAFCPLYKSYMSQATTMDA